MNIKIKENLKKTFYFLLLFSLGIVFLVSLLSSTSQDNTFLKFNSSLNESENILGYFGSVLSDFVLNIFGIVSYVLCLFFLIEAFRMFGNRGSSWYSWTFLPFLILLLCFTAGFLDNSFININLPSGIL